MGTELSSGQILQCPNGCLICEECYPQIIPCKCPLCRCAMNKTKPIRCRIAERALSLRLVTCRHDGCSKEVLFSKLNDHEMNECQYKPINCKFSILGCEWKGLRHDQQEHEAQCEVDQDESLAIVQEINDTLSTYKSFCSRCTSLHSDTFSGVASSESEEEFDEESDPFYFEGFEYKIRIKSERKQQRIRRNDTFQIKAQIAFDEDEEQLDDGESIQVNVGIIMQSHAMKKSEFIKEFKFTMTQNTTSSEWLNFETEFKKEEYKKIFRGGFDLKIFCFGEDL